MRISGAIKVFIAIVSMTLLTACENSHSLTNERTLNHVVLCWLKDSGNAEQRQQIIAVSQSFKDIPGVLNVKAGEAIPSTRKIVDDTFDVAILITVANEEDLANYLTHPIHKKATEEVLPPLIEKILVYDFMG